MQPLKLRSAFGIADLQSKFLDLGRHETCRPTFKTFSAFFAEWVHRYIVHWHKYTFSNQVFCIVLIALTLISFIKWWSLVEVRDVNRGSVIGNFWSKFALQIVDEKQDCWTEDLINPCFPVFCHPSCHADVADLDLDLVFLGRQFFADLKFCEFQGLVMLR